VPIGRRRSEPAHLWTDRCDRNAEAFNPLAEIGWHADADFMTERLQVRRKRHERLDIATRSDCRKEYAHQNYLAIILELKAGNQR
jgi:hypothetical protein